MDSKEQNSYNFSSVDLLIYIWKKRYILIAVGVLAGVASIVASSEKELSEEEPLQDN